jgi:hypothetical protein
MINLRSEQSGHTCPLRASIVEVDAYLLDQVPRTPVNLAGFLAPRDKLASLMIFQLIKDCRTPHRTVHTLDGQGKQEIALQAGREDAGIQDARGRISPPSAPDA